MKKISELYVILEDVPGTVSELLRVLKKNKISIYAVGLFIDTARLLVSNPQKGLEVVQEHGYVVELRDVIRVELPNKPGAIYQIAHKVANAGININNLYGAVGEKESAGILILETDNIPLTLDIFRNDKF
jgi:hypothetical protein